MTMSKLKIEEIYNLLPKVTWSIYAWPGVSHVQKKNNFSFYPYVAFTVLRTETGVFKT